jgi:hypothetical protein
MGEDMTNFRNKTLKYNLKQKGAQTLLAAILSQSLNVLAPPAFADTNSVKIAGQPIFTIANASNSGSIANRTATIQENLDNALVASKDHTPSSVNISYVNGTPVITLGGYQVATVVSADATTLKTTPALLANQWADKIRHALVDQASINSYIAQISGTYASSAPAVSTNNYAPLSTNTQSSNAQYSDSPVVGNAQQQNRFYQSNSNGAQNNQSQQSQSYDAYNSNSNNQHSSFNQGNANYGQQNPPNNYQDGASGQGLRQGRIAYAQVGQIIPVTLNTSIATQVAQAGDLIQATVSKNVAVGDSVIPAGSQVLGQVTEAKAGGRLTRSGELQIKFTRLRLADGSETPISAHIVGTIGKYAEVGGDQSDQFKGETTKNKVGSVAFRGLLGAGGGAALGTAVGAIAGGGHGAGMGAWSGAAIGGGLGAADSLILRKGANVTVKSGTNLQLELDSPVAISGVAPAGGGYQ